MSSLLSELVERGRDFSTPRMYILDGGKALHAAVRRHAGEAAFIQRCQVYKKRNVVDHLPDEHKADVKRKLQNAYAMADYADAKRALEKLHRETSQPACTRYPGNQDGSLCSAVASVCGTLDRNHSARISGSNPVLDNGGSGDEAGRFSGLLQPLPNPLGTCGKCAIVAHRTKHPGQTRVLPVATRLRRLISNAYGCMMSTSQATSSPGLEPSPRSNPESG